MATILVAEDSATQAVQIRQLLEAAEFQVRTVADGEEALAAIAKAVPDLVLTDLNMPRMDGLELVVSLRRDYPQLPVVLMTAFGSEEIAAQALHCGAASYVPKRNLARDLVETLRDVLDVASTAREEAAVAELLSDVDASFVLPSHAPPTAALLGFVHEAMSQLRLGDETDRVRVGVALDTAVHNLLYYGNLELAPADLDALCHGDPRGPGPSLEQRAQQPPFAQRQIHVRVRLTPHEVRCVVRHEGPPIDWSKLSAVADADELDGSKARGWLLANTFMSDVSFDPAGSEVTLVRGF